MDRFPIPKVGLSVKWGLSYCPNLTGVTRVLCVTAAFAAIDHLLNEMISYVCVLRVSPLCSRVYMGTPIEVSVSKGTFYTSNAPHILITNDQKEFRNDCGACAILSVHPVCQTIFLVHK